MSLRTMFLIYATIIGLIAAALTTILIKVWEVWRDNRSFEKQAKQIHNQSAQYLSQDLKRLTPEQFMKHYRGRLR